MDVVVVAFGLSLYPKLLALCFDEEFVGAAYLLVALVTRLQQ